MALLLLEKDSTVQNTWCKYIPTYSELFTFHSQLLKECILWFLSTFSWCILQFHSHRIKVYVQSITQNDF